MDENETASADERPSYPVDCALAACAFASDLAIRHPRIPLTRIDALAGAYFAYLLHTQTALNVNDSRCMLRNPPTVTESVLAELGRREPVAPTPTTAAADIEAIVQAVYAKLGERMQGRDF